MTFHSNHDAWLDGLPEAMPGQEFARLEQGEDAPLPTATVAEAPRANPGALALGATAAVMGAATLLQGRAAHAVSPSLTFADIPGTGDIKVLNYALALEALEADLYRQAAARVAGLGVRASAPGGIDLRYYQRFGRIEMAHRDFLDRTLGDASLLKQAPFKTATFNFGFSNLPSDPSAARAYIAEVVLDAERTGVAAYLGALPLLVSKSYRQIAAAIQGTEARHTAVLFIITNRLGRNGIPIQSTPRNVAPMLSGTSSAGNNDITPQGREATTGPLSGMTLITRGTPGTFVPQPTQEATPDNVLDKVSPFIVLA